MTGREVTHSPLVAHALNRLGGKLTEAWLADELTKALASGNAERCACTADLLRTEVRTLVEQLRADTAVVTSVLRGGNGTCGHVYDDLDTPVVCTLPAGHPRDHEDDRTAWPREDGESR